MAVTTLDPRTALIVVDLQNSVAALPTAHPMDPVVQNAADLAAGFRSRGLPVVLVRVDGRAPGRNEQPPRAATGTHSDNATELVAGLNHQPGDHVVVKRTWGSFTNTGLAEHLAGLGVTQVVVAGVATSIGVESTARQAHELGLNVTLAVDAMTDMSADAHNNSLTRIFPRLGETGSTRAILALLAPAGN
ncbi:MULTISPECIES: cysteine hydrolase family protein [unclassified Arthrobacter]|uniref:cysteine hydrolase family protein n=1 Tax=unclassified Arthrobacter TaxID=235627 RepID=UPI00159D299B|nr:MULTISPECIES: isochorismatase family protein [unclassified Arthrobacter]MCQ9163318.1 isochorismatase family protein [Arthrobacter sp. STN4]NVM98834.1 isochorismatase family protein [Arthrobacter sp. SDTb3-6]